MVAVDSGVENSADYASKGNYEYALIEINLAIEYTKYALESCKGEISSVKMDELSKNLVSLKDRIIKIEHENEIADFGKSLKKAKEAIIENKLSKNPSSKTIYTITKDDNMRDINGDYVKRSVEVILSKKVSPDKLKEIAYAIKQIDKTSYKRTFIGYHLSDTDSKQGYWATTHFNPNLEVKILGMSIEDEKIINNKDVSSLDRKVIGSWYEDRPYVANKMILYYAKNRFYLEQIYTKFTKTTEMSFEKINDGIKIVDIKGGSFGEYYLLTAEGDFEFWSKTRNYYKPKKLSQQKISQNNLNQMIELWDSDAYKKEKEKKVKNELSKRTKQIEVTLEYYTQDTLTYFTGTTNLPENTKIGIRLNDKASDFEIYIKEDGSFLSTGFSDRGGVLSGNYKVEVMIYSNISWQTKEIIEKLKNYYGYGLVKEGHASIVKHYSF